MSLSKRLKETAKIIKRRENMFTTGDAMENVLKNQYQIMLALQEVLAKLEDFEDIE